MRDYSVRHRCQWLVTDSEAGTRLCLKRGRVPVRRWLGLPPGFHPQYFSWWLCGQHARMAEPLIVDQLRRLVTHVDIGFTPPAGG
jgi:hypothetical protein